MDVIIYPCFNPDAGLANLLVKEAPETLAWDLFSKMI